MRYIAKGTEPQSLSHARAALKHTPGLACDLYDNHLDTPTRQDMLDYCLREQQGLCAYTGMDASNGKGHIEHLVPRSISCPKLPPQGFQTRPFETIDWDNLVACFPKKPSGWSYCAGKKDKWPSDIEKPEFVSPLDPSCEKRFRYGKQGTIKPADDQDIAAKKTIEKLGLDHDYLTEARKVVLETDQRIRDTAQRRKLLASLDDRTREQAAQFAFQRSQVLKRLWAGTI